MPPRRKRAFSYHAGVTLNGTQLTCDAAGFATDLVFLSHAKALAPGSSFALSPRRAGRRQLLATEGTLVLLGGVGERLRARTLPAVFGRAFNLGGLRLALVPAGYLPGAASLLCEVGGRRLLYAGTICRERAFASLGPAEPRCADAVCLDATFGDPRFVLPPREEAEATLRRFVEAALAGRRAPVLLVSPCGPAPATVEALQAAGVAVRAHGSIVGMLARFRQAGASLPTLRRFAGKLGANEALLWPPEEREAPVLGALDSPTFAFVSGFSVEPTAVACMRADQGIALSNQAGFAGLVAYLEATGAHEVALHRGFAETFAAILRQRGYDAYAIDPPRQMELFRG
ncbi:MAG TPA: hypothetical protein VJ801_01250 [Polyangia bacterium]|jgi:hypothetical protein|nr:hypothetical protein [Polyangia bacterium]